MTVRVPGWLSARLSRGYCLFLMKVVIAPALDWLVFDPLDRWIRRRVGIPEDKIKEEAVDESGSQDHP